MTKRYMNKAYYIPTPMALNDYERMVGKEVSKVNKEGFLLNVDGTKYSYSPHWVEKHNYFEQFVAVPDKSFTFEAALTAMRLGKKVVREGWLGHPCYVSIDTDGSLIITWLGTRTLVNEWKPTTQDILAGDWALVFTELPTGKIVNYAIIDDVEA